MATLLRMSTTTRGTAATARCRAGTGAAGIRVTPTTTRPRIRAGTATGARVRPGAAAGPGVRMEPTTRARVRAGPGVSSRARVETTTCSWARARPAGRAGIGMEAAVGRTRVRLIVASHRTRLRAATRTAAIHGGRAAARMRSLGTQMTRGASAPGSRTNMIFRPASALPAVARHVVGSPALWPAPARTDYTMP
jgi:hypothetical protein